MIKPLSDPNFMDRLGASLSVACALHCALQPVLLLFLPFLGLGFLLNEQAETVFLVFSAALASLSLLQGHRHHGQIGAFPVLALGLGLIVASRLPGLSQFEMILAVSGALGIAISHGLNMYLHRLFHQTADHEASDPPSVNRSRETFATQEAVRI